MCFNVLIEFTYYLKKDKKMSNRRNFVKLVSGVVAGGFIFPKFAYSKEKEFEYAKIPDFIKEEILSHGYSLEDQVEMNKKCPLKIDINYIRKELRKKSNIKKGKNINIKDSFNVALFPQVKIEKAEKLSRDNKHYFEDQIVDSFTKTENLEYEYNEKNLVVKNEISYFPCCVKGSKKFGWIIWEEIGEL